MSFLDLGSTPVANALLTHADEPSPEHPLVVGVCRSCRLVQLLHVLAAEDIFDAEYPYFSSFSDQLVEHSRRHVAQLVEEGAVAADGFVVEVASNDGYLLKHLLPHGVRVLGVEPSPGPARAAREAGVPTVEAFLTPAVAESLRSEHGAADVIVANNVMAHVPDLRGFVRGLGLLLAERGVLHVENPGVDALLEHTEFDTVYHEHFCYFSTTAVDRLMDSEGLFLNDVERFPHLHGGTLRWSVSHRPGRSARLEQVLAEDRAAGLSDDATYLAFGGRVRRLQDDLVALLADVRRAGGTVAAYGAAAKGATLLNSTGLAYPAIAFVVDRNPVKQGRWLPGARVPVLETAALLERQPSHVLVLAWNVLEEVRRQQAEYERRGGRFIVPVPQPRVLEPS